MQMRRSIACIISPDLKRDKDDLTFVARQFSYAIEMLEDGVLFDVSGLGRLVGKPSKVAGKILEELQKQGLAGSVAVADTVETAVLLARQDFAAVVHSPEEFQRLPLQQLPIEQDTLNVFGDLGLRSVEDLMAIPHEELIGRYGREFRQVIDIIEQKGRSTITPNVKDDRAEWTYELDQPIENFEQLIFLFNHGLEKLFAQTAKYGRSTEQLDVIFKLREKGEKEYEIKTSFPTLERAFWLKLINLRISLDPPESGIVAVRAVSHFTKPRASQLGLYAVSRPEPENLLLTVGKLKKLVGEENVGVPVMLDERMAESFTLNADALPKGLEKMETHNGEAVIAFSYYRPPVPAEVLVRDKQLVFLRTSFFSGRVINCSGVWRGNSKWWEDEWRTEEWDVEVEDSGVYRLCKVNREWFLTGEYD
jgi:protein ImuB